MRIWAIKRKWKHKFSFIFWLQIDCKNTNMDTESGIVKLSYHSWKYILLFKTIHPGGKNTCALYSFKKYLMSDNKNFISGTRHFSVCLEAARKRLRKQPHWTSRKWSEDTRRVGAYTATALSVATAAESILIVNIFVDRKYGHKDSNIFMSRAVNTQL